MNSELSLLLSPLYSFARPLVMFRSNLFVLILFGRRLVDNLACIFLLGFDTDITGLKVQ
jgi:hypothetical protein